MAVYICDFCGRQMQNKVKFDIHMRSHTNERPFECEQCGRKFKSRGNLSRHMRLHTEDDKKEFACPKCGK